MKELQKAEVSVGKMLSGLPNISESARESVAKVMPLLALIGGLFQLAAAYWVYKLAHVAEQVDQFIKSYSVLTGGVYGLSSTDKFLIYVGALVLLVEALVLLMAYSGLKDREKRGWDMLFLAALINVGYSVVSLFITGRGFGSFLFGLVGSAFGFWLLFQIKSKYSGKSLETSDLTKKLDKKSNSKSSAKKTSSKK
ncbi:MAG: hypothetical protein H6799_01310 [Candidatus Nomurabacteria bacterium]|nr:MAG: hypothetical protein H6799_01310 [Candidatus Nomurabacteria bacterium]HRV75928.1 hypothetical protein [Candidatus Saccharimonadales bacterium]